LDELLEDREDVVEGGVEVRVVELDVGDDGGQRLVDLMGDRRCQCAQRRRPRRLRELGAEPSLADLAARVGSDEARLGRERVVAAPPRGAPT